MSVCRMAMAAMLAISPVIAAASVSGSINECAPSARNCEQRITLSMQPTGEGGEVSVFVGILAIVEGQPHPGAAGWYDGRRWSLGKPAAAWTGRLTRTQATVPVPGGVCQLVRESGGPAGTYGVFVGWGRAGRAGAGGLDEAEVRRMISVSPPEQAQRLRELLANYQEASRRASEYDSGGMTAFMDMRQRNAFSRVKSFNCEEGSQ